MDDRITVYEKTTCSTCRSLVKLLQENGIEFDEVDYMIEPIPTAKLKELLRKAKLRPRDVLRTKENTYRELNLADTALTDDQILDAIAKHPELLQRPIVEKGEHAVLARPPEKVLEIL
jgi:arsenate reductase (glutaredoxin)